MEAKIQNKKILHSHDRLLCNGKSMNTAEIIIMIQGYLRVIKPLKELNKTIIDQSRVNEGIRFVLFGIPCTVGLLFKIYNEMALKMDLPTYSKLWYNPKESVKFSPSKID